MIVEVKQKMYKFQEIIIYQDGTRLYQNSQIVGDYFCTELQVKEMFRIKWSALWT